ncbi:TPA: pLS20_p028 family conjugation system transmembrane protein [Enterococcus hirae]
MIDQLIKFQDLLHIASFWMDPIRNISYTVLKGLAWVIDSLSGAAKEVYQLMNFYNYEPVKDFINKYQPIIWALATVALAYFGWQLIVNRKLERDRIINNIVLALTIFFVLPWAMQQGAELTTAGVNVLQGKESASVQTFKNNITDLYTVDKNGWKSTNTQNDIKDKSDVEVLDISEKVDTEGGWFSSSPLSQEGRKLLTKRLTKVDGKFEEIKMKDFWSVHDPTYYRYSWHPWLITIELITKGVVYAFVIFKTAKLINELGLLYVITSGISLTDIKNGQRNSQLAIKIRDTFIVLYLMMFMINFFDIWSAFVADSSLSSLVKPIAVAGGAWLVIDGPNFIEQLFGIDAGLSSVGRTIVATVQGGSALRRTGSDIVNATKSVASKAAGVGRRTARGTAYTGAAIKGALAGFSDKSQSKPEIPNGSSDGISGLSNLNKRSETSGNNTTNTTGSNVPGANEGVSDGTASNKGVMPLSSANGVQGMDSNGLNSPDNEKIGTVPEAIKNLSTPKAPLSHKGMEDQAKRNKEAFDKMGINPNQKLKNISNASKARQALDGKSAIPLPPKISGDQLPKHVQEAKAQLQRDMQPRPVDTETLGDKIVNKYADTARNIYHGSTMTRSRKVYDVSKATSKRVKDSFRD